MRTNPTRRGWQLVTGAVAALALASMSACAPKPGPSPCTDTVTAINAGEPGLSAFPPPFGTATEPPSGWWSADTRANGSVDVNDILGAPAGFGCTAASLATGATDGGLDKAQLFNYEQFGTPLSDIDDISYWAKKSSASTGGPAIHLSVNVAIIGASVPSGFATLVYEPYQQSGTQSAIQLDTWQEWDATATTPGDGLWWTNKIPSGPGSQAEPMPWADFQALYPDAAVAAYGFNLGSYNPDTLVAGDGLTFGPVTTDF